jgi:hypothetical protein
MDDASQPAFDTPFESEYGLEPLYRIASDHQASAQPHFAIE